jgi:hypothetical protein
MAGFVYVEKGLPRQGFEQFLIRCPQGSADLVDDLGQLPREMVTATTSRRNLRMVE